MNELQVINFNGQYVVDSREVADMVGKQHWEVLRMLEGTKDGKTKGFIKVLTDNNFVVSDYFIPHSYKDGTGRTLPCYLLTKLGCEMVANKLTGEKGVLFTATYVKKFNEMEQQQRIDTSKLSPELQMFNQLFLSVAETQLKQQEQDKRLNEMEQQQLEIKQQQENIKEIVALNPTEWRKKVNALINRIARENGDSYQDIRAESYKILEERARCQLSIRLTNKKQKMALEGVAKSKIDRVNKMDVIADDARLTEIYLAIVKEMAIKYQIDIEGLGA